MQQETEREKDEEATGTDLPNADGQVADEDVHAITDDGSGKKTGQDHSLDNYEDSEPDSGVGNIQDYSDTSTDIVHISD